MTIDPAENLALSGLLPDGQQWTLEPLLFGNVCLSVGPVDSGIYTRSWHYTGASAAHKAIARWLADYDDTTEPTGWFREPATGRRRPDGDPAQEYIHP